MASKRIDIQISGKNTAKSALSQASNEVKQLSQSVKSANSGLSMASGFNKIKSEARSAASSVKSSLSSIKANPNSIISGFSSAFNRIKTEARTLANQIKSSFEGLGGMMASLLGGVTLGTMVQQAGSAESKWNRIAAFTGQTGESLKAQKVAIRGMADQYGVVNGQLSSAYETMVRFTGSQDQAMENTKGIAALSKTSGKDVDAVTQAIMSGEMGRNKTLQREMLTKDQIAVLDDDSLTTQEKINKILKMSQDIVAQNPDLVTDSESAWNRMQSSIDTIMVTLGTSLLPVIQALASGVKLIGDAFVPFNNALGGIPAIAAAILIGLIALGAPLAWAGSQALSLAGALGVSNTAALGLLGTLGLIAGLGLIVVTVAVVEKWSSNRLDDPNYIPNTFGNRGFNPQQQPQAQNLKDTFQNSPLPLPNFALDTMFNNWDIVGELSKVLESVPKIMGDSLQKPIQESFQKAMDYIEGAWRNTASYLKGAWNNTVAWFGGLGHRISQLWGDVTSYLRGAWSNTVAYIRGAWNNTVSFLSSLGGKIYGAMASAFSTVATAVQGGMAAAYQQVVIYADMISSKIRNIGKSYSSIPSSLNYGTSLINGPRGPSGSANGLSFNYQNYAGHREGYPIINGNCITGNCLDMSMGLAGMYGGSIGLGQWYDGNPHAWYVSPSGRAIDPTNIAFNSTTSPPPQVRGPSNNGNIIINGDVYGFDDFQKKVGKAMDIETRRGNYYQ